MKDCKYCRGSHWEGRDYEECLEKTIDRLLGQSKEDFIKTERQLTDLAKIIDSLRADKESLEVQVADLRKALEKIADPMSDTHHVCCANWPESKGYPCNCDTCTAKTALGIKLEGHPECTCTIDGTPYCKASGTPYCLATHPNGPGDNVGEKVTL